jgi:deoxyadenosine/deoxycytidine kinase
MIIMLNGPFGVGKSTVAQLLHDQLPHSMIYDPEIIGAALRALTHGIRLPAEETDDFQDLALWPRLTVLVATQLYQHYRRHLIVPMTIVHAAYFATITAGFAAISPPLYHFCLVASPATVYTRLRGRGVSTEWPWRKSQHYLPRFADQRFQIHIDTEQQSPDAIVQVISEHLAQDQAETR